MPLDALRTTSPKVHYAKTCMYGIRWLAKENRAKFGLTEATDMNDSETPKPDHQSLSIGIQSLAAEIKRLEARCKLLEAALGLPEGCDVFELQRAQKEGAVDGDGDFWDYVGSESHEGPHYPFKVRNHPTTMIFEKNGQSWMGYSCPPIRLYCRKEAK